MDKSKEEEAKINAIKNSINGDIEKLLIYASYMEFLYDIAPPKANNDSEKQPEANKKEKQN